MNPGSLTNLNPGPEFHLPDEDRVFYLTKVPACPVCGAWAPRMHRRICEGNTSYQVHCVYPNCCSTPSFPSSNMAVSHWKAICILSSH